MNILYIVLVILILFVGNKISKKAKEFLEKIFDKFS